MNRRSLRFQGKGALIREPLIPLEPEVTDDDKKMAADIKARVMARLHGHDQPS